MSRKMRTTPDDVPRSSLMAAALSSMGRSLPSLAMRRVWFPSPTVSPRSMTIRTGCSTACRVVFVDDAEDLLDLFPGRFGERPSGQRLGDGIEVVDAARRRRR